MRIYFVILLAAFMLFLGSCTSDSEAKNTSHATFKSYKDIPGVSEEEINAIEQLKQTHPEFVYGVNITMEAFFSNNGKVEGFASLLCQRLSELYGIKFVPSVYSWDEMKQKLSAGEIDFSGELTPTADRQKIYLMSDPIVQRMGTIFVNKNADKLSNIAKERPIRCAFLKGSTLYPQAKNSWGLPFEAIFVDDTELPALFEKGLIDAFIDENTMEAIFENCEFVKAQPYFPLIYSPVSLATGNKQLEPIISVMNKYLKNGGFYELSELYKQGIEIYSRHKLFIFLDEDEKEYIRKHSSPENAVLLAVENENYPMAFYNTKEEEFQGIAMEVLDQIASLTGLKFKVANAPETIWPTLLEDVEKGEISIISELLRSKRREGRFLWTQKPYCVDNYALLSRADYPDVDINQILYAKVGLITESAYAEIFYDWFPDSMNTVSYVKHEDAFEALQNGEIDLLMGTQNMLLNMTNYLERPGFKANIVFQDTYSSVFGFNKDEVLLQSIVNKAQNYVDTEGISQRWKLKVFDYKSKMLKDIMPFMVSSIGLLILGLFAVFFLLLKNRKMSRNLEKIVETRTGELKQASSAKSEFLSRMSHEMRTPMNAIIGMTEIAERSSDTAKLKYCLETIGVSSRHLLSLINDILDMSKIEAGKFNLDCAPLNIEELLKKICGLVIDKMEQSGQKFTVLIGKGMPLDYLGDELRISQVIANILSNAMKFTPEGGQISLSVDEVEKLGEQSVLRFSISDTGIGMSPEQTSRLFNAFEQADGSITKRFGGTGLGLAISKNIVGKMDGKIWVNSELGKGSTFNFEIKLKNISQKQENLRMLAGVHIADIKVLVADADNDTREQFCAIMNQIGIACEAVNSAQAVINAEKIAQNTHKHFDVIFIDFNLTDMNTVELLEQLIGKVEKTSLAMTGSLRDWNKIEDKLKLLGVKRFIAKPLFPSDIFDTISEVVGKTINKSNLSASATKDIPDLSEINLLLAEDVQINQEIFISLMEDTGVKIDTVENGLEAVRAFEAQPNKYDIIVMDLQMPEMDGYEATRAIRGMNNPRGKTIPILAMTANAFKEDVEKCIEAGMNDHVAKPIDINATMQKINNLTKK